MKKTAVITIEFDIGEILKKENRTIPQAEKDLKEIVIDNMIGELPISYECVSVKIK